MERFGVLECLLTLPCQFDKIKQKVLKLKGTQSLLLSWFIAVLQCLLNKTININLSPESCAEKEGGLSTTELQNNI